MSHETVGCRLKTIRLLGADSHETTGCRLKTIRLLGADSYERRAGSGGSRGIQGSEGKIRVRGWLTAIGYQYLTVYGLNPIVA
jgi:hypothetical protein